MTFRRGTINIGIRESIRQEAAASGFFSGKKPEDITDSDLLAYVVSRHNRTWLLWLAENGDLYGKRGAIKKECKRIYEGALIAAVHGNDAEVARRLMEKNVRLTVNPGAMLFRAIMKRRYEMADLLIDRGIRLPSRQKLA